MTPDAKIAASKKHVLIYDKLDRYGRWAKCSRELEVPAGFEPGEVHRLAIQRLRTGLGVNDKVRNLAVVELLVGSFWWVAVSEHEMTIGEVDEVAGRAVVWLPGVDQARTSDEVRFVWPVPAVPEALRATARSGRA